MKRRDFLSNTALFGASAAIPSPVERLLNLMTDNFIRKAQAETAGVHGPRNYINILMSGAPLRYSFDHWMRTHPTDPVLDFNAMVATKFVSSGGRVTGVENATFNYNGVLVPHMFSHSVYSSGGMRPLTDLLNNMLVIRGFGTGFDGHVFNAVIQQTPAGGLPSIGGLAADSSKKPFEAIQWPSRGSYSSFVSVNGKALNKLGSSTPVKQLLEGFAGPQPARLKARSLKERNAEAFDLAQSRLKAYANSSHFGSKAVAQNFTNATEMMKKGLGNIDGFWTEAVSRYSSIIEKSMRQQNLAGLTDVPMISAENRMWQVHVASGNRGLIVSKDMDMRSSIDTMTPTSGLAEGLALVEYVLREGLATSADLNIGSFYNLRIIEQGQSGFENHVMISDMHESGTMGALLYTSAYYRGLAAGILELSEKLKAVSVNGTNLWAETVIQLMSDFGRSARTNGSGSDHGYNQLITSVFSGAFDKGPYVVGNILKSGHNSGYAGTQGIAAAIDGYNQKGMPTPVVAASTVAALLRLPKNPFENLAAPLVSLEGGVLRLLHSAKIVGG